MHAVFNYQSVNGRRELHEFSQFRIYCQMMLSELSSFAFVASVVRSCF